MSNLIGPLNSDVPVTNPDGTPTPLFMRLLHKLQISPTSALQNIGGKLDIALGSLSNSKLANMAAATIKGNKEVTSGSPEDLTITQVLDLVGNTRGAVLYRGASGWSILAPGTSGNILQTNGAGADPTWAAPAAGGGTGYEGGPVGTVPLVGSLTWLNQGGSTASNGTHTLLMTSGTTAVVHALVKAVPAAPFDIYCRVDTDLLTTSGSQNSIGGIVLQNSTSGNQVTFHTEISTGQFRIGSYRWTSAGAFSAAGGVAAQWTNFPIRWVRVNVTSTTITMYMSSNGLDWISCGTETIATYLGAVNQYGLFTYTSAGVAYNNYSYFSTTAPV